MNLVKPKRSVSSTIDLGLHRHHCARRETTTRTLPRPLRGTWRMWSLAGSGSMAHTCEVWVWLVGGSGSMAGTTETQTNLSEMQRPSEIR